MRSIDLRRIAQIGGPRLPAGSREREEQGPERGKIGRLRGLKAHNSRKLDRLD